MDGHGILEVTFWVATVCVIYTYIMYPVAIWLVARFRKEVVAAEPIQWPSVAVVIAIYNDADHITHKINNLRKLDYPGVLTITFSLDGCTDEAESVLRRFPEVEVCSYPDRRGKPAALNHAVAGIDAEILVFTDMRQALSKNSVRRLVTRLQDPEIGAVSGELVHYDAQSGEAASIGLYWRYERWIRSAESRVYSIFGATGALYAVRRSDFEPIATDTILDDFQIPIQILAHGKRSIMDGDAQAFDSLEQSIGGETRRKIRTLTGNFQAFARNKWLFNPLANKGVVQFLSHKVLRLLIPYALIVCFVVPIILGGPFYIFVAALQLIFYTLATIGKLSGRIRRKSVLFSFPNTFVELNVAAVRAFYRYLARPADSRWERS